MPTTFTAPVDLGTAVDIVSSLKDSFYRGQRNSWEHIPIETDFLVPSEVFHKVRKRARLGDAFRREFDEICRQGLLGSLDSQDFMAKVASKTQMQYEVSLITTYIIDTDVMSDLLVGMIIPANERSYHICSRPEHFCDDGEFRRFINFRDASLGEIERRLGFQLGNNPFLRY